MGGEKKAKFICRSKDVEAIATFHTSKEFEPDFVIRGREVYETADPDELKLLRASDAVVEVQENKKGKLVPVTK